MTAGSGGFRTSRGGGRGDGVLELFDTRYWDFEVKRLYETLVAEQGFRRSSLATRSCPQAGSLIARSASPSVVAYLVTDMFLFIRKAFSKTKKNI